MKKLLLSLVALLGLAEGVAADPNPQGNWTDEGNYDISWYDSSQSEFTISTPAQLAGLAVKVNSGTRFLNQTIKLMGNIDLGAHYWVPIGKYVNSNTPSDPFSGVFDGQRFSISNLITEESTKADGAGLFGTIKNSTAVVKSVVLSSGVISAYGNGGAIVGLVQSGTVEDCLVESSVTIKRSTYESNIKTHNFGSICAYNQGTVKGCVSYAKIELSKGSRIGGVVGNNDGGSVKYCVFGGTLPTPEENVITEVGVIIGAGGADNCSNNYYTNALALGQASTTYGGKMLRNISLATSGLKFNIGNGTVEPTYNLTSGITYCDGQDGLIQSYTLKAAASETVNFTLSSTNGNEYAIENLLVSNGSQSTELALTGEAYTLTLGEHNYTISYDLGWTGTGIQDDPYVISDTYLLNRLSEKVGAGNTYSGQYFVLRPFSDTSFALTHEGTTSNFTPIGTSDHYFSGIFDGEGNTISGLYINEPSKDCVGLFGYVNSGTVKNLRLSDATIVGEDMVGGLVGRLADGLVENCHIYTSAVTGVQHVGGIVGYAAKEHADVVIKGCVNKNPSSVCGTYQNVGGIVGYISEGIMWDNLFLGDPDVTISGENRAALIGMKNSTGMLENFFYNNGSTKKINDNDVPAYAYDPTSIKDFIANENLHLKNQYLDGITAYQDGLLFEDVYYTYPYPYVVLDVTAELVDRTPYKSDLYGGKQATTATYQRIFTAADKGKYKGWFVPFDYTITADAASKFAFFKIIMIDTSSTGGEGSSDKQYIHLEALNEGDVLYGNYPYVYRATTDDVGTYNFTSQNVTLKAAPSNEPNPSLDQAVMTCATTQMRYIFYGVLTESIHPTPDIDHFYYMNASGKFSKGTKSTTEVGPYRWIFRTYTKPAGDGTSTQINDARMMFDFFDGADEASGIDTAVEMVEVEGYYTLDGKKVQQPVKGLYIVKQANGETRKVMFK